MYTLTYMNQYSLYPTHLHSCVVEEEELRTSFLEEEKEREPLGDLGGGRMEQWEAFDRFNLSKRHTGISSL